MTATPRRLSVLAAGLGGVLMAVLGPAAAGQSVLAPGDIGVVTSDGFFRLRAAVPQGAPVNTLPAVAFGPGTLTAPRIAWERGTDNFLVCTGPLLFRVAVAAVGPPALTDLTPSLGAGASLRSIELHPGTGELFLHDATSQAVLGLLPPFAAGMTPSRVLPAPPGVRAMCLDSRELPASVIVATSAQVSRLPLDGTPMTPIAFAGASGLDDHPLAHGGTLMVNKKENLVDASTGSPNLVQNLNLVGFCSPIALAPAGVVSRPDDSFALVLAEDGLNPNCVSGGSGPNQVVAFPPAQGPILPQVLTNPADSGITGTNGALALVTADFAFPSPWGSGCPAPSTGKSPELDCNTAPVVPQPGFALELAKLPAGAPVFLILGWQPLAPAMVLPSGCTVLVSTILAPFLLGTAAANGKLTVPAALPASLPPGLQLQLQAALSDGGQVVLGNALLLHFAP